MVFHAFRNYNMKPLVRYHDCLKFISHEIKQIIIDFGYHRKNQKPQAF